jgi:hypothetical protein
VSLEDRNRLAAGVLLGFLAFAVLILGLFLLLTGCARSSPDRLIPPVPGGAWTADSAGQYPDSLFDPP